MWFKKILTKRRNMNELNNCLKLMELISSKYLMRKSLFIINKIFKIIIND